MMNSFLISQRRLANIPLYNVISESSKVQKHLQVKLEKPLKDMDGRKHHPQLPSSLKHIRRSPRILLFHLHGNAFLWRV
ncbi:hypothetical protein CEXT_686911 [Caerostris extrusa]|uniref:Uncharacterized protein n=1 Tax=Caerostris extrusa TaxID=172846 RepID=A0AAV4T744_CAEEX|nr:hypothetical protein CEXT_686911 [Caerostris extrusa]